MTTPTKTDGLAEAYRRGREDALEEAARMFDAENDGPGTWWPSAVAKRLRSLRPTAATPREKAEAWVAGGEPVSGVLAWHGPTAATCATWEWESASCASCGRDEVPCKSNGIVWTCRDCEPTPAERAPTYPLSAERLAELEGDATPFAAAPRYMKSPERAPTVAAAGAKRCPYFSRAQGYQCDQPAGHDGWCSNAGDGFAPGYDPKAAR